MEETGVVTGGRGGGGGGGDQPKRFVIDKVDPVSDSQLPANFRFSPPDTPKINPENLVRVATAATAEFLSKKKKWRQNILEGRPKEEIVYLLEQEEEESEESAFL